MADLNKFVVIDENEEVIGSGETAQNALSCAEEHLNVEGAQTDAPFPVYLYEKKKNYTASSQGVKLVPSK